MAGRANTDFFCFLLIQEISADNALFCSMPIRDLNEPAIRDHGVHSLTHTSLIDSYSLHLTKLSKSKYFKSSNDCFS